MQHYSSHGKTLLTNRKTAATNFDN